MTKKDGSKPDIWHEYITRKAQEMARGGDGSNTEKWLKSNPEYWDILERMNKEREGQQPRGPRPGSPRIHFK